LDWLWENWELSSVFIPPVIPRFGDRSRDEKRLGLDNGRSMNANESVFMRNALSTKTPFTGLFAVKSAIKGFPLEKRPKACYNHADRTKHRQMAPAAFKKNCKK